MRIISGTHRGRRIIAPKNLPVRPTTDMAKEALFNILRHQLELSELNVLELFSGSGNMSYEFCSRGAQSVIAVDQHHACVSFVQKTAEEFEFPITAIKSDVFPFLNQHNGTYDLVFADPPYALELDDFMSLVDLIFDRDLLQPETDEKYAGMLIIEHSKHTDLSTHPRFDNARKYGGTVFSFFK